MERFTYLPYYVYLLRERNTSRPIEKVLLGEFLLPFISINWMQYTTKRLKEFPQSRNFLLVKEKEN